MKGRPTWREARRGCKRKGQRTYLHCLPDAAVDSFCGWLNLLCLLGCWTGWLIASLLSFLFVWIHRLIACWLINCHRWLLDCLFGCLIAHIRWGCGCLKFACLYIQSERRGDSTFRTFHCRSKQECIFFSLEGKNKSNACLTSIRFEKYCTFDCHLAGRRSRLLQQISYRKQTKSNEQIGDFKTMFFQR